MDNKGSVKKQNVLQKCMYTFNSLQFPAEINISGSKTQFFFTQLIIT